MPRLSGILETALYVKDLPRARGFYEQVMGLGPPLHADGRMCAYDVNGRGVLLLFMQGGTCAAVHTPGGTIPPHDATGRIHMAFSIPKASLPAWEGQLAAHDIVIEGSMDWVRGGRSLYFRDPDGHLIEIATPRVWEGY